MLRGPEGLRRPLCNARHCQQRSASCLPFSESPGGPANLFCFLIDTLISNGGAAASLLHKKKGIERKYNARPLLMGNISNLYKSRLETIYGADRKRPASSVCSSQMTPLIISEAVFLLRISIMLASGSEVLRTLLSQCIDEN